MLADGGGGAAVESQHCAYAQFSHCFNITHTLNSRVWQPDRQTDRHKHPHTHSGGKWGCLLCLVFHNWDRVRFGFVFAFGFEFGFGFASWAGGSRLRPLQVCTSNVRKLNFSWLPQMLVSVSVCVCMSARMCVCYVCFCGLLRRLQAVLV